MSPRPWARSALTVTTVMGLGFTALVAASSPTQARASTMPAAPAADGPSDGLVAWYPLNESAGSRVADASGRGQDATVAGAATWAEGAGFRFSGGAASSGNSIKLPDHLIAGLDSITVTMDTWVDPQLKGAHFVYNLGNAAVGTPESGNGYLFSTSTPYRATISDKAWGREQVTKSNHDLSKGVWKRLTYTQTGTTGVLYEDGQEVARNSQVSVKPADIGSGKTTRNVLGASAYAADGSFQGILRDVRIYDHALTSGEVADLTATGRQALAEADASWALGRLGDTTNVVADLALPTTGPRGTRLAWESSNPAVIAADGTVNRSKRDEAVTLTVSSTAGTTLEQKSLSLTVPGVDDPDQAATDAAAAKLSLPGLDDVRSNITLPASASGLNVRWSSSAPDTLSADGVLTRPATGQPATSLTLTATITRGAASTAATFEVTVPALPRKEDPSAYLFTYFTADSVPGEKIYFGASNGNNARDWISLNKGAPVLTSTQSTKGLRDPFIVRSPEGDTFYLIATDLSIGGGTSWNDSQRSGSKYLEVWESHDLVNWSEQRHVKVSPDNAGNTWAPEAYWDATRGEYVVFWASKLYGSDDPDHTKTSPPNTMMFATTRDFRTFSEAKPWQDTGTSRIDSTVIEEDGTYYRFTKDEGQAYGCLDVFAESSASLTQFTDKSGGWDMGQKCIGKSAGTGAVEGPTVFKANPGDVNGGGYYLFVDEFSGRKYLPLHSDSLTEQKWNAVNGATLPSPAPRHGTVLPVTASEYEAIMAAYLPEATAAADTARTIGVGDEVTLPSKVAVSFKDGSTQDLAVVWESLPTGYNQAAGTVQLSGTVAGLKLPATATITVKDERGDGALLRYDFSQLGAATAGTTVPDASGNGLDGTVRGNGATVKDDVLTLPGGTAGSSAAYVQMPTGAFDGQDTLTVSVWLKNTTGAGNYAALFFGSTQSTPSNYWLFNPRNGSNQFKSVITGSVNASAPWNTEKGIAPTNAAQGIAGPETNDEWALYTTVIEPGKLTGYLNGTAIGTVATDRKVSDLGTNLVAYIGRSSYADKFYAGGVKDLLVTTKAATAQEVAQRYYAGAGDDVVNAALTADADALSVPESTIASLNLASNGAKGSSISWTTSDAGHLAADGTVTRDTRDDVTVTLTATLALGGRTATRDFQVTVLSRNPANDVERAAAGFDLGLKQAWKDVVLLSEVDDVSVSWASSDTSALDATGTVTRGEAPREVTLTATFSKDGASAKRDYVITVLARDTGSAASYLGTGASKLTDVLHLATASEDGAYTPGNKGKAILYPTLGTVRFGQPTLFRRADGGFGLVAPEVDNNGPTSKLFVFDSDDLVAYSKERLVSLPEGIAAESVQVAYRNSDQRYVLEITAKDGQRYSVSTADFGSFSKPERIAAPNAQRAVVHAEAATEPEGLPSSATGVSVLPLTAAETERISTKLGRTTNVGVDAPKDQTISVGDEVPEPEDSATVRYSSGSTSTFGIVWNQQDLDAVDASTPGTYTVNGTVEAPNYEETLVERRADPDVTLGDDGWYYFTGSYPMVNASDKEGYDRVILRRAKTIAGLKDAEEVSIWDESSSADFNPYIWAPELQKIGDDWYVLFTAARKGGVWDIRPVVLKYTGGEFTGEKVMDASNWTMLGQVKAAAGDNQAFTSFSLDMTAFEQNGRHYVIWAEKPGASTLRMGEIDPKDPTQLLSPSILLSEPTQAWERNDAQGQQVDEGPSVIHHNGKVYVSFSASTVDRHYAVGLLTANDDADLMDPSSWVKTGYPVLTTDDVPGQMGPGHNSFTTDEWGNPVIVFHSRTENDTAVPGEASDEGLYDPRRHARAATVHFDVDGAPVFNLTAEEELDPSLASVSYTVRVTADEEPGSGSDGGSDGGTDGGSDGGSDGGTDAGSDGGTDGGSNGGPDGGSDGQTAVPTSLTGEASPQDTLAPTGLSGTWWAAGALALLVSGALALASTRRRRQH
ncbi:immunoglobulin-like domain-containing protein [Galactobacter valiniphilus]